MTKSKKKHELGRMVWEFVERVQELSREIVYAELATKISAPGTPHLPRRRAAQRVELSPGRFLLVSGRKRNALELRAHQTILLEAIRKDPGRSIEAIADDLKLSAKDLHLPRRRLIAEGLIHTQGAKRATTYWPGKS